MFLKLPKKSFNERRKTGDTKAPTYRESTGRTPQAANLHKPPLPQTAGRKTTAGRRERKAPQKQEKNMNEKGCGRDGEKKRDHENGPYRTRHRTRLPKTRAHNEPKKTKDKQPGHNSDGGRPKRASRRRLGTDREIRENPKRRKARGLEAHGKAPEQERATDQAIGEKIEGRAGEGTSTDETKKRSQKRAAATLN
jgi:hypothetical protein